MIKKEYLEAEQETANKTKDSLLEDLPPEERAKFEAVEKAVKILVDAKVLFYLFPSLRRDALTDKKVVWQWNSMSVLACNWDKNEKIADDPLKSENAMYHQALFTTFFKLFYIHYQDEDFIKSLGKFADFTWFCMNKHRDYLKDAPK